MPKPTGKRANASKESLPSTKSDEEKILRALKNLLKIVGSSYRKADAAMGLSRGTLSRLFRGKAPLKLSHIIGICRLANLDLEEFFPLVYLRPSSPLLATNPASPADPPLPEDLSVLHDFLDPYFGSWLLREEQEEIRELLRVACSSLSTAPWVLWWLEAETRRKSLWSAFRSSMGMSGGCLDPNG